MVIAKVSFYSAKFSRKFEIRSDYNKYRVQQKASMILNVISSKMYGFNCAIDFEIFTSHGIFPTPTLLLKFIDFDSLIFVMFIDFRFQMVSKTTVRNKLIRLTVLLKPHSWIYKINECVM